MKFFRYLSGLSLAKVRTVQYVMLGVGALTSLVGAGLESSALMGIGIGILALSVIYHIVYYRCPHCGAFLDRSTGEYCPHCGKEVNKPEK